MSPGPQRAQGLLQAGRHTPPTSFLPSLTPCQALQLEAMATGPKKFEKSLREPHAGGQSSPQPKGKGQGPGQK